MASTEVGDITAVKGRIVPFVKDTDPKLRALLATEEYSQLLALLTRLEASGRLPKLLDRALAYWALVDIGDVSATRIRKDWPMIYGEAPDEERNKAFDVMNRFWSRLDSSKVLGKLFQQILPESRPDYTERMTDLDDERVLKMDDEELRREYLRRLEKSKLAAMYVAVSESDAEVLRLAPRMIPFIALSLGKLQTKIARSVQTVDLPPEFTAVFVVIAASLLLVVLSFAGLVKTPSLFGEDVPVGYSTPSEVTVVATQMAEGRMDVAPPSVTPREPEAYQSSYGEAKSAS